MAGAPARPGSQLGAGRVGDPAVGQRHHLLGAAMAGAQPVPGGHGHRLSGRGGRRRRHRRVAGDTHLGRVLRLPPPGGPRRVRVLRRGAVRHRLRRGERPGLPDARPGVPQPPVRHGVRPSRGRRLLRRDGRRRPSRPPGPHHPGLARLPRGHPGLHRAQPAVGSAGPVRHRVAAPEQVARAAARALPDPQPALVGGDRRQRAAPVRPGGNGGRPNRPAGGQLRRRRPGHRPVAAGRGHRPAVPHPVRGRVRAGSLGRPPPRDGHRLDPHPAHHAGADGFHRRAARSGPAPADPGGLDPPRLLPPLPLGAAAGRRDRCPVHQPGGRDALRRLRGASAPPRRPVRPRVAGRPPIPPETRRAS